MLWERACWNVLNRGRCGRPVYQKKCRKTCGFCAEAPATPVSASPPDATTKKPNQQPLRSRPRKRKQARGRAKNQGKDWGQIRSPMAPAQHWSGGFFPRDIGYVLVDVRRSGEVDPRVQVTLQMLVFAHNVRAANSSAQEGGWAGQDGSGAALWVGASMVPKVPPLVRQLAMVRSLPEGVNPLIGKAHALLHSPFNISVLVDGDSWICVGWLPRLQARLSRAPLPQPRPLRHAHLLRHAAAQLRA